MSASTNDEREMMRRLATEIQTITTVLQDMANGNVKRLDYKEAKKSVKDFNEKCKLFSVVSNSVVTRIAESNKD